MGGLKNKQEQLLQLEEHISETKRDIAQWDELAKQHRSRIKEYEELFSNPYVAASRGFLDAVIYPRETRPRIIDALRVLLSKRESRPPKKHGNIPM